MFDLACWPPVNERFFLILSLVRFHSTQNRVIIENWENKQNFRTCAVKSRPCSTDTYHTLSRLRWHIDGSPGLGRCYLVLVSVLRAFRILSITTKKILGTRFLSYITRFYDQWMQRNVITLSQSQLSVCTNLSLALKCSICFVYIAFDHGTQTLGCV